MQKRIYFIRHGQSFENLDEIFYEDPELTPEGRRQAEIVAERCTRIPLEVVLASTLARAQETGRIVSERISVSLVTHDVLRESRVSEHWTGRSTTSEYIQTAKRLIEENIHDSAWRYEGAENYFDLHARACRILELIESRPERTIGVIAHAHLLKIILTAILTGGEPDPVLFSRIWNTMKHNNTGITLCSVHEEEGRGVWKLLTWNDHEHLG